MHVRAGYVTPSPLRNNKHWADDETDKAFASMRIKAFTKWANSHLKSKGIQMDDITKELSSGLNLCYLLSLITDEQVTPPNGPKEVELET